MKVEDASNNTNGFKYDTLGDPDNVLNDYYYDAYGNMVWDKRHHQNQIEQMASYYKAL